MPRMLCCRRRVNVSSDDFVGPAVLSIIWHAVFVGYTAAALHALPASSVGDDAHTYCGLAVAVGILQLVINVALAAGSCMGTMAAAGRREVVVPWLFLARTAALIAETGICAYGVWAAAPSHIGATGTSSSSSLGRSAFYCACIGTAQAAFTVAVVGLLWLRGRPLGVAASLRSSPLVASRQWSGFMGTALALMCCGSSGGVTGIAGDDVLEELGLAAGHAFSSMEEDEATASDVIGGMALLWTRGYHRIPRPGALAAARARAVKATATAAAAAPVDATGGTAAADAAATAAADAAARVPDAELALMAHFAPHTFAAYGTYMYCYLFPVSVCVTLPFWWLVAGVRNAAAAVCGCGRRPAAATGNPLLRDHYYRVHGLPGRESCCCLGTGCADPLACHDVALGRMLRIVDAGAAPPALLQVAPPAIGAGKDAVDLEGVVVDVAMPAAGAASPASSAASAPVVSPASSSTSTTMTITVDAGAAAPGALPSPSAVTATTGYGATASSHPVNHHQQQRHHQSPLTTIDHDLEILHSTHRVAPFTVPWFATVDRATQSLVISFRGTFSMTDALTDMHAMPYSITKDAHAEVAALRARGVDFGPDDSELMAHSGMWLVALEVRRQILASGVLEAVADGASAGACAAGGGGPGNSAGTGHVAVTVHATPASGEAASSSLCPGLPGAGTAVPLAVGAPKDASHPLLVPSAAAPANGACSNSVSGGLRLVLVGHSLGAGVASLVSLLLLPRYPSLRVYAYSPPGGLVTEPLAKAMEPWVTSLCVGADCVAHMSVSAIRNMYRDIRVVRRSGNYKKPVVLAAAMLRALTLGLCSRGAADEGDDGTPGARSQSISQLPAHAQEPAPAAPAVPPPGVSVRALAAYTRMTVPGRALHTVYRAQRPVTACFHKQLQVEAAFVPRSTLGTLVVAPEMFSDHMPDCAIDILKYVLAERGVTATAAGAVAPATASSR